MTEILVQIARMKAVLEEWFKCKSTGRLTFTFHFNQGGITRCVKDESTQL